jgi:two-component system, cell cycle sensor histidine kinase PleC
MAKFREGALPGDGPATPIPRIRAGEQRMALQRRVREIRARLLEGPGLKPEFEYDLIRLFALNEVSARTTVPLLAVILASALWAPPLQAAAWVALVLAMKLFMVAACIDFISRERSEVSVARWGRRFAWLNLVTGATWGGIAALGLGAADAAGHIFLLTSLVALLAIRIFASAGSLGLCAATVPLTLAVAARLAAGAEPFHLAMAAIAVGLHACFVFLAREHNATALAMIECRAEKDALIAENEGERAICDEARRRAEAASAAKSRFLATMSHELRTPLNAILGFSEVMKGELLGPIDNGSYREYAANIHESGRHLLQLIDGVLDLARIEAGRYELNEEPVRLAGVVEDCLRLLNLRVESKGLNVALIRCRGLEPLWADARAVRQICLNLISNALKFTPRGGHVTITVANTPEGGQVLVVKDTGPGIPKEEIPRVMQAFGQGSLAHQVAEGGTGLGLPIVQSLVAAHGGTFELRSVLRKGTEAIVRLPPSRLLRAAAALRSSPGDAGRETGPDEQAPEGMGKEARRWWQLKPGTAIEHAAAGG